MKKMVLYFLALIFFICTSYKINSLVVSFLQKETAVQTDCEINNSAFSSGEELDYKISYNWGLIWLEVGQVVFKVEKDQYNGIPCYKLSGIGGTYTSYDWIFKVRDRYECWVDSVTLKPFRSIRDIHEGGTILYNECYYNYKKNKAYCVTREQGKVPHLDTVSITSCSFDPLTMIYYSRNIDFSPYKVNDTIPVSFFLDNKVYPIYVRYMGKDKFKTDGKEKSTFNCCKFSPKMIAGTIFKGGEGMSVLGTDDKNRIPLFVEAPVLVGTVKATIASWKGLRNKMDAKVE